MGGLIAVVLGLSVINKILFRMVLASVGRYVHALSCSTNFAYLFYSWCVVLMKAFWGSEVQRSDLRRMVDFALRHWDLFASIGVCESAAFTILPVTTAELPK